LRTARNQGEAIFHMI